MKNPLSGQGISPFENAVKELIHGEVRSIPLNTSASEAAGLMAGYGVGSLVVMEGDRPVGILTKTDLAYRVVGEGLSRELPVGEIINRYMVTIGAERPIFEALLLMIQNNISHLLVMDGGQLTGVISERDWLTFQERHPAALIRRIGQAESVEELAGLRKRALNLVCQMFQDDGTAAALTALVTEINDRTARRTIELALADLEANGGGGPPVPFAWIAMGSEGRSEQTLSTDQDNGLIFQDVPEGEVAPVQGWFLRLAARVVDGLEACGFPRCKGNVMASNPDLCLPLGGWREKFAGYLTAADEEALVRSSIYFDFRCLYGEASLVDDLWDGLMKDLETRRGFLRYLSGQMMESRPPEHSLAWRLRSLFGFALPVVDLKRQALAPLTAAARVMSLAAGSRRTHTLERLEVARGAGLLPEPLAQAAMNAYDFLMLLRLRRNFRDELQGRPLTNRLTPGDLNPLQRRFLVETLRVVSELQAHVHYQYGGIAPV